MRRSSTSRPRRRALPLLTALCLTAALLLSAIPWQGAPLADWVRAERSGTLISGASTSQRVVALTFDDGPDPRTTPRILAILHRYGVKATFFEQGRMVETYPELARAVCAEGHVIGNHTVHHPYLTRKSPAEIRSEIEGCDRSFAAHLHLRSYLFRPPRGQWNPTICRIAQQEQDHIILWTVALEHHEVPTPPEMANRVLRLIRPGAIVLMHDGAFVSRETTVEALPLLLEGLRARGFRCLTVPEMLHIRGDERLK